jgi:hypothetical protein
MLTSFFCLFAALLDLSTIVVGLEPLKKPRQPIKARNPPNPPPQVVLQPYYYVKPGELKRGGCDMYADLLQKAYVEAIAIGRSPIQ